MLIRVEIVALFKEFLENLLENFGGPDDITGLTFK